MISLPCMVVYGCTVYGGGGGGVCVCLCVCVCSPAVENSPQSKHNLVVDTQENIPIYPGTLRPATLLFAKG